MGEELGQLLTSTISVLKKRNLEISSCIDIYGKSTLLCDKANHCRQMQLDNESGTGEITIYPVFSGIDVVFNDMQMGYCNKNQPAYTNVLEINHCKQGR